MYRWIFIIIIITEIVSAHLGYPPTPQEFRGLWCISKWNQTQQNYSEQIGQAFFYNNGTFTLNFLTSLIDTWVNRFAGIHKKGEQGTYHIVVNTSRGPIEYVRQLSCYWRRQIANDDILWGRQSNGTCTPTFELDTSDEVIVYTRNALNCLYIDDEHTDQILSNTNFENELRQFDKSIQKYKPNSIVFYGSSSIRLWSTLNKDFSNSRFDIINRGFGGSTLNECVQQFKRVILPLEPSLLIFYAGENDLVNNYTSTNIQNTFREFILKTRQYFPLLPVVFISIKPSPSRKDYFHEQNLTNHKIQEAIQTMNNVAYIDIFNAMLTANHTVRLDLFQNDSLHMNEKGYDIWREAIQEYLNKNGYTSKGSINCQLSFLIFVFNLLAFFFLKNSSSIEIE